MFNPESYPEETHVANHEDEESEVQLMKHWEEQTAKVAPILKLGLSNYLAQNEELRNNLPQAFKEKNETLFCIDEGTEGCFHIAGSGILLPDSVVVTAIQKAGIKSITSHKGCGAAAVAAQKADRTDVEAFAEEYARRIADLAGIQYREHVSELHRPKEFHNARAVYYDGTGSFSNHKVDNLPTGFIISRGILEKEASLQELQLAISIATGKHGYGNLITNEQPLLIIPIGRNQTEVTALEDEIKQAGITSDKVKIDGLVAPQEAFAAAA